uniref:Calcineurin-like phosphoesterase domain-containing protein n=1 Tax=Alexandrium catenella TaxID=2925 RepID=A0A7S1SD66_ALECA|mmetsp:Transcript_95787/g.254353  ORF Transcript_95787/g.254353 Transcript_95787/m.254353 type:complete len:516 (+) Transcript_95787:90-1637(+)|eukprot:CAMPEP_0171178300 /NCGR_PEP_ID=MMETSP0790-20130122/12682_1 /TAXON_ID=2925 /ORGANISM="Alexandrium catenella, Strain OF101" /LENGTH=515 /DNA_ID=CAMNT_0011643221 /DNA_START=89 /DNA_END=1636 /DNA_ORIENTATION=+
MDFDDLEDAEEANPEAVAAAKEEEARAFEEQKAAHQREKDEEAKKAAAKAKDAKQKLDEARQAKLAKDNDPEALREACEAWDKAHRVKGDVATGVDAARQAGFVPEGPVKTVRRIWCVSDVHCDHEQNQSYFKQMDNTVFKEDVLILAGDISHELDVLETVFTACKERFAEVFFVPGNHELWVKNDTHWKESAEGDRKYKDSMDKMTYLLDLCESKGVRTKPGVFECGGEAIWVVPVMSYHARSFDTEPDIADHWDGIGKLESQVKDFACSVWPSGLDPATDDVADALDGLNDTWVTKMEPSLSSSFSAVAKALPGARAQAKTRMITYSHFVPRLQLNPEKRFLFYPNINKAIGSRALEKRVNSLRPDVHVFGHTHFGWDAVIDGTRYIQAPLAMPKERSSFSVTVIGDFPDFEDSKPLLLRDGRDWPETYQAGWSEYYKTFPREAYRTEAIQGRMMRLYKWKGPGPQPSEELCFKDRKPGWELAPSWVFEKLAKQAPGFDGGTHGMMLQAGKKS